MCIGLIVALMTGCSKPNPLIGKWQMTQNMGLVSFTVTREFKDDGTEIMSGGPQGAMSSQMTYKVDGDTLTESVTQMTIGGNTMKVDAANLPANAPKSMTETFAVDGDKLTLTSATTGVQTVQNYTRVTQ
jgi:hypothetical protein